MCHYTQQQCDFYIFLKLQICYVFGTAIVEICILEYSNFTGSNALKRTFPVVFTPSVITGPKSHPAFYFFLKYFLQGYLIDCKYCKYLALAAGFGTLCWQTEIPAIPVV